MSEVFNTIAQSTESLFKDRGSKFHGYTYPISSVEDVKPILDDLRNQHSSARHVCYAYQLGTDGNDYRANDDGEPNGSAGLPILNQIKSKEVTNVLVAVVRYFGGTKLGISGLINAYKQAARSALDDAKVIEKIPTSVVRVQFSHDRIGDVERLIRQNNGTILQQDFGMDCQWTIEYPKAEEDKWTDLIKSLPDVVIQ